MPRSRRTVKIVPESPDGTPVADVFAERASALIAAARLNPLPRDEVMVRLANLLRRDFSYAAHRQRVGTYTAYDELLEQSMEAVASAVVYLQEQSAALQSPAP